MNQPKNMSAPDTSVAAPALLPIRLAHCTSMRQALAFLEEQIRAAPDNTELLKIYRDLCVEDAKLEGEHNERLVERHKIDSAERVSLRKLEIEGHGNQTKSLIETNKAYLEKNVAGQQTYPLTWVYLPPTPAYPPTPPVSYSTSFPFLSST